MHTCKQNSLLNVAFKFYSTQNCANILIISSQHFACHPMCPSTLRLFLLVVLQLVGRRGCNHNDKRPKHNCITVHMFLQAA